MLTRAQTFNPTKKSGAGRLVLALLIVLFAAGFSSALLLRDIFFPAANDSTPYVPPTPTPTSKSEIKLQFAEGNNAWVEPNQPITYQAVFDPDYVEADNICWEWAPYGSTVTKISWQRISGPGYTITTDDGKTYQFYFPPSIDPSIANIRVLSPDGATAKVIVRATNGDDDDSDDFIGSNYFLLQGQIPGQTLSLIATNSTGVLLPGDSIDINADEGTAIRFAQLEWTVNEQVLVGTSGSVNGYQYLIQNDGRKLHLTNPLVNSVPPGSGSSIIIEAVGTQDLSLGSNIIESINSIYVSAGAHDCAVSIVSNTTSRPYPTEITTVDVAYLLGLSYEELTYEWTANYPGGVWTAVTPSTTNFGVTDFSLVEYAVPTNGQLRIRNNSSGGSHIFFRISGVKNFVPYTSNILEYISKPAERFLTVNTAQTSILSQRTGSNDTATFYATASNLSINNVGWQYSFDANVFYDLTASGPLAGFNITLSTDLNTETKTLTVKNSTATSMIYFRTVTGSGADQSTSKIVSVQGIKDTGSMQLSVTEGSLSPFPFITGLDASATRTTLTVNLTNVGATDFKWLISSNGIDWSDAINNSVVNNYNVSFVNTKFVLERNGNELETILKVYVKTLFTGNTSLKTVNDSNVVLVQSKKKSELPPSTKALRINVVAGATVIYPTDTPLQLSVDRINCNSGDEISFNPTTALPAGVTFGPTSVDNLTYRLDPHGYIGLNNVEVELVAALVLEPTVKTSIKVRIMSNQTTSINLTLFEGVELLHPTSDNDTAQAILKINASNITPEQIDFNSNSSTFVGFGGTLSIFRCDESGTQQNFGMYIKVTLKWSSAVDVDQFQLNVWAFKMNSTITSNYFKFFLTPFISTYTGAVPYIGEGGYVVGYKEVTTIYVNIYSNGSQYNVPEPDREAYINSFDVQTLTGVSIKNNPPTGVTIVAGFDTNPGVNKPYLTITNVSYRDAELANLTVYCGLTNVEQTSPLHRTTLSGKITLQPLLFDPQYDVGIISGSTELNYGTTIGLIAIAYGFQDALSSDASDTVWNITGITSAFYANFAVSLDGENFTSYDPAAVYAGQRIYVKNVSYNEATPLIFNIAGICAGVSSSTVSISAYRQSTFFSSIALVTNNSTLVYGGVGSESTAVLQAQLTGQIGNVTWTVEGSGARNVSLVYSNGSVVFDDPTPEESRYIAVTYDAPLAFTSSVIIVANNNGASHRFSLMLAPTAFAITVQNALIDQTHVASSAPVVTLAGTVISNSAVTFSIWPQPSDPISFDATNGILTLTPGVQIFAQTFTLTASYQSYQTSTEIYVDSYSQIYYYTVNQTNLVVPSGDEVTVGSGYITRSGNTVQSSLSFQKTANSSNAFVFVLPAGYQPAMNFNNTSYPVQITTVNFNPVSYASTALLAYNESALRWELRFTNTGSSSANGDWLQLIVFFSFFTTDDYPGGNN